MRVAVPAPGLPTLIAGALAVTGGLALVPAAGADVLVSTPQKGRDVVTAPVLVAPDGAQRPLAAVDTGDDGGARPVVSPDRRFVAYAGTDDAFLVPTDGTPATKLDAFAGAAAGGSAFWWLGPTRVVSFSGGLSIRGSIETCGVPTGGCKTARAPGGDRIGTFASGASLWLDSQDYTLPEGLTGVISDWTTATAPQVRRIRAALRRKLRQRLILRSPTGRTRVLKITRRSSVAGTDTYSGLVDGGPQVAYTRTRARTTLLTRSRNGRTQAKLRFRSGTSSTGVFSASGKTRPFRFRTPAGTIGTSVDGVAVVPGGWLVGLSAKDGKGTPLVGTAAPGGAVRTLQLGGKPLTARTLSAAIGVPLAASEKPRYERDFLLGPVGYEAATDSDVVAYDEPIAKRRVVARVPRSGAAPSLVFRGEPGAEISAIAW